MDNYYQMKELGQKREARLYRENQELRKKSAETTTGISERVTVLTTECDTRLQKIEQRDFMAKGLTLLERIKLFFQIKFNLISIQEYRKWKLIFIKL